MEEISKYYTSIGKIKQQSGFTYHSINRVYVNEHISILPTFLHFIHKYFTTDAIDKVNFEYPVAAAEVFFKASK